MKTAAIVPALNEGKNIRKVLEVLLVSKHIDEVILVDDGSVDDTADIGKDMGAKVVKLPKKGGSGKGNALKEGLKTTDAEVVVFFDADLIGLTEKHVSSLVLPVVSGEAVMCVGIRGRLWGMPENIYKIDHLLALGGERAIKKDLLEKIPDKHIRGFAVETTLNHYCSINNIKVKYILLNRLTHFLKEEKWGLLVGSANRLKMIWQVVKIRLVILFNKNEFIQKDNTN